MSDHEFRMPSQMEINAAQALMNKAEREMLISLADRHSFDMEKLTIPDLHRVLNFLELYDSKDAYPDIHNLNQSVFVGARLNLIHKMKLSIDEPNLMYADALAPLNKALGL